MLWCTEPGLITKTNIELIDGPESLHQNRLEAA